MSVEHSVQERVAKAVDCLAASSKPIQARLQCAGLELAPLLANDFVERENRENYVKIMDLLTSGEGGVAGVTATMADDKATSVAQMIVELDWSVRPFSAGS